MTAHWGIEDPAAVEGTDLEKEAAFVAAFRYLKNRIAAFTSLPLESIDRLSLGTQAARHRPQRRRDVRPGQGKLMPEFDLPRRLAAEALGTALLVATVVGSGIMAETLTKDVALALLGNTLPTGAILVVLITILGPDLGRAFQSGGVAGLCLEGRTDAARCAGLRRRANGRRHRRNHDGACDVRAAADRRLAENANRRRAMVCRGRRRVRPGRDHPRPASGSTAPAVPWLVGLYITAAYWFTASTSFANPAVAIARSMTNTFSGIRPADLPGFIAAELCGAVVALIFMNWLLRGAGEAVTTREARP